jgi:hypothetical protein
MKVWIFKQEFNAIKKAQEKGYKDVSEIYGTYYGSEEEAREANKGSHLVCVDIEIN